MDQLDAMSYALLQNAFARSCSICLHLYWMLARSLLSDLSKLSRLYEWQSLQSIKQPSFTP